MGESFMTAGTQISELLDKREAIFQKVATLIASAVIDKARNGKVSSNSTSNDIQNLICEFTADEQSIILKKAIVIMAMNQQGVTSNYHGDTTSRFDNSSYEKSRGKKSNNRSSFLDF